MLIDGRFLPFIMEEIIWMSYDLGMSSLFNGMKKYDKNWSFSYNEQVFVTKSE